MRYFLVERAYGRLRRVTAFDFETHAQEALRAAEGRCPPFTANDRMCVLLGSDSLASCIATHGNWFDAPNPLLDELLAHGLKPVMSPEESAAVQAEVERLGSHPGTSTFQDGEKGNHADD